MFKQVEGRKKETKKSRSKVQTYLKERRRKRKNNFYKSDRREIVSDGRNNRLSNLRRDKKFSFVIIMMSKIRVRKN